MEQEVEARARTKIYVSNLPEGSQQDLRNLCAAYGTVLNISFKSKNSNYFFAFVQFSTSEEAALALEKLKGSTLSGKVIYAELAKGPKKVDGRNQDSNCYYCRKKGHMSSNCPEAASKRRGGDRQRSGSRSIQRDRSRERPRQIRPARKRSVSEERVKRSPSVDSRDYHRPKRYNDYDDRRNDKAVRLRHPAQHPDYRDPEDYRRRDRFRNQRYDRRDDRGGRKDDGYDRNDDRDLRRERDDRYKRPERGDFDRNQQDLRSDRRYERRGDAYPRSDGRQVRDIREPRHTRGPKQERERDPVRTAARITPPNEPISQY